MILIMLGYDLNADVDADASRADMIRHYGLRSAGQSGSVNKFSGLAIVMGLLHSVCGVQSFFTSRRDR